MVSDPSVAAEAVVSFVVLADDLDEMAGPAMTAAREDRIAWIAYPKARQLGTDLNRDILAGLVEARGAQPVRSVSIEGSSCSGEFRRPRLIWSAHAGAGFQESRKECESSLGDSMSNRFSSGSRPRNADASSLSPPWTRPAVTTPNVMCEESSQ